RGRRRVPGGRTRPQERPRRGRWRVRRRVGHLPRERGRGDRRWLGLRRAIARRRGGTSRRGGTGRRWSTRRQQAVTPRLHAGRRRIADGRIFDGRLGLGGRRRAEARYRRLIRGRLILLARRSLLRVGPLRPGRTRGSNGVGGQRGHAVDDRVVHGWARLVRLGAVGGSFVCPTRRRAVRQNAAACRTVGCGIVARGGSRLAWLLAPCLPGRCREVARPGVLVVDEVVVGSSRSHHGGRASSRAIWPVRAPVQAVLPLIQTLTRLSPDATPIWPPMRRRRHSAGLVVFMGRLCPRYRCRPPGKSGVLADLTQSAGLLGFSLFRAVGIRA